MKKHCIAIAGLTAFTLFSVGCASKPEMKEAGFLGDYTNLKPVNDNRMAYISGELKSYQSYIVDPIQFMVPPKQLSEEDRVKVAEYARNKLIETLKKNGYGVTDKPGAGVARVRIAFTGVSDSTWWQKVHPISRSLGAGTGGASMEAETVDSVSGKQLNAVVQSSTGNQFDFTAFSTVADVESAVDKWIDIANDNLAKMRKPS